MKCIILVVAVLGLCLASATAQKNNGQPGCQTELELSVRYYRHFHNKTQYWTCEVLGQPGRLSQCPIRTGWLDDAKACVPWAEWYWTPTVLPPSQPARAIDGVEDEEE